MLDNDEINSEFNLKENSDFKSNKLPKFFQYKEKELHIQNLTHVKSNSNDIFETDRFHLNSGKNKKVL